MKKISNFVSGGGRKEMHIGLWSGCRHGTVFGRLNESVSSLKLYIQEDQSHANIRTTASSLIIHMFLLSKNHNVEHKR
jgi:hypothetical protein